MRRLLMAVIAVNLICAACQKPVARLNAPPHGDTENPSKMQSMYTGMLDGGLLVDMSISDVHFLPHRAQLSTLGEERLSRLANLMEMYGGEIRFSTALTDAKLVDARTERIKEHLSAAGIDTSSEVVVRDLRGGEGMDAHQAILIKANEATYKPKQSSGGGSAIGTGGEKKGGGNMFHDVNRND